MESELFIFNLTANQFWILIIVNLIDCNPLCPLKCNSTRKKLEARWKDHSRHCFMIFAWSTPDKCWLMSRRAVTIGDLSRTHEKGEMRPSRAPSILTTLNELPGQRRPQPTGYRTIGERQLPERQTRVDSRGFLKASLNHMYIYMFLF